MISFSDLDNISGFTIKFTQEDESPILLNSGGLSDYTCQNLWAAELPEHPSACLSHFIMRLYIPFPPLLCSFSLLLPLFVSVVVYFLTSFL